MKLSVSFLDVVAIVLIILKVAGVIDWSWWIVFSPMIASFVIVILLFLYNYYKICKDPNYRVTFKPYK